MTPVYENSKRTLRRGILISLFLLGSLALGGQERFRKSPPSPEPLQELRLPAIESKVLSNGLTVVVAQKPRPSMISLQLVIRAGESDSPKEAPGTASLTAELLSRGTQLLSSTDIEEMIESIGGNFSLSVTLDTSIFTFSFLEEHLDRALGMLSALVLGAALTERETDTVKRVMYYNLLDKEKSPEFVAKRHLLRVLFANHPYQIAAYSDEVIKDLSSKDAQAFYERFYRPNNALIVLAGNLNLTTASRKVSHYFNTWAPRDVVRPLLPSPPPNEKEKVCFVDLPDAKDASICVGNIVMPATSPDWFPFLVLNQVLGGTTNSRLFMNLRESKGYAYYAFSETEFYRSCGVFRVSAQVTPGVVYPSVQEILKELMSVDAEKVPAFEAEQAKAFLIGNFPLKHEALNSLTQKIAQIKAFNLGDEHWNRSYESIMLINPETMLEVAQRYLHAPPVIVIAGDKSLVVDHLRDFEVLEIYNSRGVLTQTIRKGVEK